MTAVLTALGVVCLAMAIVVGIFWAAGFIGTGFDVDEEDEW